MNTKHIIYLLFSFFFCHVAYGDKCTEPLTSLNFENFTLFHMLKVHDDKDEKLATWIHFFFNQFSSTDHAVSYLQQLNINIINQEDQACFIRAFNIFLLHQLSYHTKCVISNGEKNYYEKKYVTIKQYCTDFFEIVNTPSLHKYFDTVIIRKLGIERIEGDLGIIKGMIKKATLEDPAKFTADPMKALTAIKMVENVDDPSIDPVKLAIRDYQLLAILSLKNHYYNSNITTPILDVRREIDNKVRLWFRKRSKLFPLYVHSSMLFGSFQCHVDGKTYYETPDYFVHGFFSAIKEKMTKIYIRFLSNFNNAVEKKSYKIESLKGIRYLKSLFLRKTFPNFVRLHVDYMETELSFLRETFLDMYDNTINCYATKYANIAGANFIDSKMIPE